MIDNFFQLKKNKTSITQELLAGVTTFVTMAYIVFVNPQMMSASGMDQGASFVGTCLAKLLTCFVMASLLKLAVSLNLGWV